MKRRPTDRPMTTGLYLLRCVQIGLTIADLDYLEYGQVLDMMTESGNDECKWQELATQADFDRF